MSQIFKSMMRYIVLKDVNTRIKYKKIEIEKCDNNGYSKTSFKIENHGTHTVAVLGGTSDSLMVSRTSLLYAISHGSTSNLFKNIAITHLKGDILITSLKLTRKQYYSRISLLTEAGLVKREKGKYLLTAFGKVIYNVLTNLDGKLENALNNYWKLKAIDAIHPSREERNTVFSALIDDQEIRSVLLNEEPQLSEAVNKKVGDVHDTSLTVQNEILDPIILT